MKGYSALAGFARTTSGRPVINGAWRKPLISQRHLRKVATATMLSDIRSFQATGIETFSRKDMEPVLWAGIFGSFAIGKQTEDSDVDVVVIHTPEYYDYRLPCEVPFLEDLLPKAWGRNVDVIHLVSGKKLSSYLYIEALLCSQTIYGSVEELSVAAVRKEAQDIYDTGLEGFQKAVNDIRKTRAMALGISIQVNHPSEIFAGKLI